MSLVQVGDHELYYEKRGTGDPVLLIMGVGATSEYWGEAFLAGVARRFTVVSYDHRGIGRSGRTSTDFTVADLADDAAGLLRELQLHPAHVVGFSLGGMVAQELAVRHSDFVRRLVLAGTAAGGGPVLTANTLRRLNEAMLSADPEHAIDAGLAANVSARLAGRANIREDWKRMVAGARMPLRTVQRQLQAVDGHDARNRLDSITAPVLVLHGSEDAMIHPDHADALGAGLSDAQIVRVRGAGHMFFWEAPEWSAELVADWLLEGSRPSQNYVEVPHVAGH